MDVITRGIDEAKDTFDSIADRWGGEAHWVAGTDVEYAIYLELGTSKMPPYAFSRPAVERVMHTQADAIVNSAESTDEIVQNLAEAIADEMVNVIDEKGLIDTGRLRRSITAKEV